ncbi:MAG TPA: MFS transporter [Gammaproteobacteria bacterium]|jgi:MFS family permease|nr:MFS transporter [Gammaproteobacteria bacterium]
MISQQRASVSPMYSIYPWLIVSCGMLFYCFNYFLRSSPAVLQDQLSTAFHINATAFGTLAGFYYWAYTPMQMPAGMIYDRFGVRSVISLAILTAASGLWVFISTDHYYIAMIGRFMIGAGCAFAYIGTLKLAAMWLPANRFAFVAGLTTAVGMTAGAGFQQLLTSMSKTLNYQDALFPVLILGVVLSVMFIFVVRNREDATDNSLTQARTALSVKELLSELKLMLSSRQMLLIGIIGCLVYLPSSVFLDTWGVPYLQTVYGLDKSAAVKAMVCTSYGWIIAGPLMGAISDKLKMRKLPLALTGMFAAIFLCLIFYGPQLSVTSLKIIFFLVGFCCGAHSIVFALGKENNPLHLSATAVAVTNMMIMAGGMICQPLAGILLDLHASGAIGENGLRIYTASDFTFALSIIPFGVALGIFLCIYLKETHGEYTPDTTIKPDDQSDVAAENEPELEPVN